MEPSVQPTNCPGRIWDRGDWVALLILGAAATLTGGMMLSHVALTGVWEDDGIYLVTAKSLAEGTGYRRIDLPGQPYQTKYPPLYPLLLSCIWRMAPGFPSNISAMQAFNAACAAGAAILGCWTLRRAWRIPAWLAAIGAASALCAPFCVELTRYTMSEHFYVLLAMGALACLFLPSARASKKCSSLGVLGLLSGLFAAGALLCRSIGVTVAFAVVATWLLRRRWRASFWAALVPSVAWGSWSVWRSHAIAANAVLPQSAALSYDLLAYSTWLPHDAATTARVAWLNSAALAWSLLESTILPPREWLDRATRADPLQGDMPFVVISAIGIIGVVLLVAVGFAVTLRRGGWPVHLYLGLYAASVLVWPFQPDRLAVPLAVFLQTLLLVGVWKVSRFLVRFFASIVWTDSDEEPEERRMTPQVADARLEKFESFTPFAMTDRLVFLFGLLVLIHFLRFDHQVAVSPKCARMQAQQQAAAAMIRERTEPDAVLAGFARGYFFLATGRQFVPILPFDDPVALYYTSDQSFWGGGRRTTAAGSRAIERSLAERAVDYYHAARVRYVLLADYGAPEIWLFAQFFDRDAQLFQIVGDAGPYRLWRLLPAI